MTYSISFADAEVPLLAGGRLYLQNIPSPASSLQFFRNGLLQSSGDFLLTGQVITPTPAAADGDKFIAFYRY